jgi:hypothetical protein
LFFEEKAMRIRHLVLVLAAALLSASLAAYAKPHGDGEGMTKSSNMGGNGNSGGDHGQASDNSPGNSGNNGNSGGTKIKVHPPQGTCDATDVGDDSTDDLNLQGPEGQAGASHVAHTGFGMIDPETGEPVASPSSAKMMYFWNGSTFDFVLNAHQLPAGSEWTLTYQPEPLPSSGVICLGSATVNGGSQLHLAGSVELDSNLPPDLDPTADPATQPPDALLALVLSADVDCEGGTMTNFEPDMYLWTNPRVRYIDTDLLPPPGP